MSTTTVKATGGGNDGGTLLHAGTIAGSRFTNLTLADNATDYAQPRVIQAGGTPGQSGNLGTTRPLSAGAFAKMETGQYVGKVFGTRIAQTDNTFLRSGAADVGKRTSVHVARGNNRYSLTDVSALSGVATYGGSDAKFTYIDPETGSAINHEPLPSDAVPGRLVYMHKGTEATQDTYKARTNP